MRKYIHQNSILELDITENSGYPLSNNIDDRDTSFIELSDQQTEFLIHHPDASVLEIWNMQLNVIPPFIQTNEIIAQQRQQAYKMRSDSLFMAYQKYFCTDQANKADIVYKQWLDEIAKIDAEYPYINK